MMKKLIPPILLDIRKRLNLRNNLYYFGNFSSWDEALRASHKLGSDYKALNIIDQVDDATQKVRQGEALYEQDGVCYYKANNNWELLAALFYIKAVFNGNFLMSVLDLGRGLGSTYFRYRGLLGELNIKWCVVEQKHFVDRGRKTVPELNFYYTVDEALASQSANVLLLSGVLMYLDKPYEMFRNMLTKDFQYIIIDESAFFTDEKAIDSIMLQHVPPSIYNAVYPAHIFGLEKFRNFVHDNSYSIMWEWPYSGGQIPIKTAFGFKNTIDKGFLLKHA